MNYLYNGVELPDINTVWTDELKEQYPYAKISAYSKSYHLVLTEMPVKHRLTDKGGNELGCGERTTVIWFDLLRGGNIWEPQGEDDSAAWWAMGNAPFWTSYDIYEDTGGIYLAASEPVLAGYGIIPLSNYKAVCDFIRSKSGKTEPIVSGQLTTELMAICGVDDDTTLYLYNGVPLPDINEVWTDEVKAQYPYAVIIVRYYVDANRTGIPVYYLFVSSEPFESGSHQDNGTASSIIVRAGSVYWGLRLGEWEWGESNTTTKDIVRGERREDGTLVQGYEEGVVWISHNVQEPGGAAYFLETSTPVPFNVSGGSTGGGVEEHSHEINDILGLQEDLRMIATNEYIESSGATQTQIEFACLYQQVCAVERRINNIRYGFFNTKANIYGDSIDSHKHCIADVNGLMEALENVLYTRYLSFVVNNSASAAIMSNQIQTRTNDVQSLIDVARSGMVSGYITNINRTDMSVKEHYHEIADINGLQDAIDSKKSVLVPTDGTASQTYMTPLQAQLTHLNAQIDAILNQ